VECRAVLGTDIYGLTRDEFVYILDTFPIVWWKGTVSGEVDSVGGI
jgi:hypothetical protein